MTSDVFFHGLREGETCEIDVAEGRTMIVQLNEIGKVDEEGYRTLNFEINGNRREIKIKDKLEVNHLSKSSSNVMKMADSDNEKEIGAAIPGSVIKVLVKEGDTVKENDSLMIIEAMKMETNITASCDGVVEHVLVKEGEQVKTGQLLLTLE